MGRKDKIFNMMDALFSISGQAAMEHLRGAEEGGHNMISWGRVAPFSISTRIENEFVGSKDKIYNRV